MIFHWFSHVLRVQIHELRSNWKSMENQWKINDFSLIFHWFLSVLSCIQRWTLGLSRIPLHTCILAGGGSRRRRELCGRVLLWKKAGENGSRAWVWGLRKGPMFFCNERTDFLMWRKLYSCTSVKAQKTPHFLLQRKGWISDEATVEAL